MTCSSCHVVSVDWLLISILSVPVEALEMLCSIVAEVQVPWVWELKTDDLLSPLRLMCNLISPNLSFSQV